MAVRCDSDDVGSLHGLGGAPWVGDSVARGGVRRWLDRILQGAVLKLSNEWVVKGIRENSLKIPERMPM